MKQKRLSDDTRQRMKGAAKFVLEFYKILMGCFLTVFVPHSCGDQMCSFSHNLYGSTDGFHQMAVLTNTLCFLAFLAMYFCEITRENWCITYLDIDATKSNDNLDTAIERYPAFKRRMHALNANYQRSVAICSAAHATNLGVSMVDVLHSWPGAPAIAPLVSYVMLVTMKLAGARSIAQASLKSERAYSAYLSGPKTYNAIDVDHRLPEEADAETEEPADAEAIVVEVEETVPSTADVRHSRE